MKKLVVSLLAGSLLFAGPLPLGAAVSNPTAKTNSPPDISKFGVRPIGDWQVDPIETQYLDSLFAQAMAAKEAVPPGPDATAQRRAIDNLLRSELQTFVTTNANSSYAPSLHLFLGHQARMRCGYSLAMQHYQAAFEKVLGSPDATALEIAHEASGALAKLLALTGRIPELDALQAAAGQSSVSSYDWGWADEMRACVTKHPTEVYKCGLYCLDQLGRLTQPGQFLSKNILEITSSTNGFTVADLVSIATKEGLRVHAALLAGTNGHGRVFRLRTISKHLAIRYSDDLHPGLRGFCPINSIPDIPADRLGHQRRLLARRAVW
jgi:hypothetical protein